MAEEVGTVMVDGMGVDKKTDVALCSGSAVVAAFADSGVEADSVANRSAVGVGADVPRVQARSRRRTSPLQKTICFFIGNIFPGGVTVF